MGPRRAADRFLSRHDGAASYRVTLYGSLAATGKGHLTDLVLEDAFGARPHEILFNMQERLPRHPNGMLFEALDPADVTLVDPDEAWTVDPETFFRSPESALNSVLFPAALAPTMETNSFSFTSSPRSKRT